MADRDAPRPKRKRDAPELPESPGPVEIAMAAAASGKPLPEAARAVLEAWPKCPGIERVVFACFGEADREAYAAAAAGG